MSPDLSDLTRRATNPLGNLKAFYDLASDCLDVLGGLKKVQPRKKHFGHYTLPRTRKGKGYVWLRPINTELFLWDRQTFKTYRELSFKLLDNLKKSRRPLDPENLSEELPSFLSERGFTKSIYTTIQSIGCLLDLAVDTQTARKNFGTQFEGLIRALLDYLGIANKSLTVVLPVQPEIKLFYRVPLDLVISLEKEVSSSANHLDERDVILSIKTSSKDRMKAIFLDRYLLKKVLRREQIPYVAIFHNDVQRSGQDISMTFVPDIFLICSFIFGKLTGVYYIDPPIAVGQDTRFTGHLGYFEDFILRDMWKQLTPARFSHEDGGAGPECQPDTGLTDD